MIKIIGGAGFLGSRLAQSLDNQRKRYEIYDKTLCGDQFVDVTQPCSFKNKPGFEIVINLAAEHRDDVLPSSLYKIVNVDGARNVCNYCRANGIKRIIFTSSVAVYGFAPADTDEAGGLNPFNLYGQTKLDAERVYQDWYEEDMENRTLVIVRPTVIFGEGNRGNVYNLLKSIANKRFIMFGRGDNKKSMAYVENVAAFLSFCTDMGNGKQVYNYVDKPDLDMHTLVNMTQKALFGETASRIKLPSWLGLLLGYAFSGLSIILGRRLPISSIRVKKFMSTTSFSSNVDKTGFVPPCSLETGLQKTIEYEFLRGDL